MQKTRIEQGSMNFGSYATRHLYFDVNKKHAKKYNESYKSDRDLITIVFVITLIVGIGAALLFIKGGGVWAIIFAILLSLLFICGIIVLYIGITRAGHPYTLFGRGVLNPAMIAHIGDNNIGLLALAEVNGKSGRRWVLFSEKVKALPGHELKIGERVPVTSFFGGEDSVSITAIAWGTNDPDVISEAVKGISSAEWQVLKKHLDEFDAEPNNEWDRIKILESPQDIYLLKRGLRL